MTIRSQKELLQAAWRKAHRTGEPLRIPCGTKSNATRTRFSLYNAVKDVRKGTQQADQELLDAIDGCSVGFDEDDRTVVVIREKVMSGLMQTFQDLAGDAVVSLEKQVDPADAEMAALQQRVLDKLEGEAVPPVGFRKTPYYTR